MTTFSILDAPAPSPPGDARRPLSTRLRVQARTPLVRAGLNLIASAGVTSVLGLAFWSLAARRFSAEALGATAGLLAAMEVIAAIASLGLRTALMRFVPSLGDRARRVVSVSYAASGSVALVCALGFAALHGRVFPELTLLDTVGGTVFFTVSTVLWVLFSLQDSVLVGLRRSSWLPVENALFALAKLGLLLVLVTPLPQWGIYVAWTAPLALFVVVVNSFVFTWLGQEAHRGNERLGVSDLVRFSAGDYAASAIWLATIDGLPLVVLALAGATASAGYHLAWTVAYTLFLVPSAVGSALLAEAAHDGTRLVANARKALGLSLALVVPGAALLAVGAPLLLSVFGSTYASDASWLLRLMALSAIPYAVNNLHVSMARAQRHVASVVRFYAVFCATLLLLSAGLLTRYGTTAAGVAWLGVQSALAIWVLLGPRRELWVGIVPTPVLRALGRLVGWWPDERRRRAARAQLAEVVPQVVPDAERWTLIHATSDLAIGQVEAGGPRVEVVKLPLTPTGERGRRREMATLRALHADPRTAAWSAATPAVLGHGTWAAQAWSRETYLAGCSGAEALDAGDGPDRLLLSGAALITALHQATAATCTVDRDRFREWVEEPAQVVVTACPDARPGLEELVATLRRVLEGTRVTVAWLHGDVSPANLRVGPDDTASGLVDWEASERERLPELDLVGLVASTRAHVRTEELGEVILALLHRPWTEEEIAVLDAGPNRHLPRPAVVMAAWLHHVATNLTKSGDYAENRTWVARNVLAVAHSLAEVASAGGTRAPLEPKVPSPTATPGSPAPAAATGAAASRSVAPRSVAPPAGPGRPPRTSHPVAAGPATSPSPSPSRQRTGRLPETVPLGTVLTWSIPPLAVVTWIAAVGRVDPRALGDLGLVTQVHPAGYLALAALVVGFVVALRQRPFLEARAAAHVGALVTILFATPAMAYPTVRYAWSWKHMGIVDYIGRNGAVDPGIDVLPIYHNWPGFFALNDLIRRWLGTDDVLTVARWWPFVLTLATVGAVCLLAATFTTDRRVVWLTAWLFVLGDWVGQEYFSPQSLAFLLYLVVIAVALRTARAKGTATAGAPDAPTALLLVLVLIVGIAVTHQITPAMLCAVLLGLALTRRARVVGISLVALLVTVLWSLWGAADFVVANVTTMIEGFGAPVANAEGNLIDTSAVSAGQATVIMAGRLVVVTIGVLALWGVIRTWREDREACITLVVIGAAPMAILASNEFGGEILFRVYLFALPVAAWFAAQALLDPPRILRRHATGCLLAVSALLLTGFLLAHFGKDGHYAFTQAEQDAAVWLYEHAPDDSLLVEGSSNYPIQFRNYERFRYVPLDSEDLDARREMAADPVGVLSRWMSDDRDSAAFLLITGSQRREADVMGHRPRGFLEGLESALVASDRFTVAYRNEDAVVFVLKDRDR